MSAPGTGLVPILTSGPFECIIDVIIIYGKQNTLVAGLGNCFCLAIAMTLLISNSADGYIFFDYVQEGDQSQTSSLSGRKFLLRHSTAQFSLRDCARHQVERNESLVGCSSGIGGEVLSLLLGMPAEKSSLSREKGDNFTRQDGRTKMQQKINFTKVQLARASQNNEVYFKR